MGREAVVVEPDPQQAMVRDARLRGRWRIAALTRRQREVLRCYCLTGDRSVAADRCFVSESAFKETLSAAYARLGLGGRMARGKGAQGCYWLGMTEDHG